MVRSADMNLFKGRVKRTKFLESLYDHETDFAPVDSIADNYLTEACRCWLNGLFISTIIMMQAAFETQLRQTYNFYFIFYASKSTRKKLNDMSFYELIKFARDTKLISKIEAEKLDRLRKLRNPFVHIRNDEKGSMDPSGTSATSISAKLSEHIGSELGYRKGSMLEQEAKDTIRLLPIFWKIAQRSDIKSFMKQFAETKQHDVHFFPNKKTIMKKFKKTYKMDNGSGISFMIVNLDKNKEQ